MFALSALIWSAESANAHAILTDSFPARGASVSSLPAKVWLEFDGNLTQIANKKIDFITLTDAKGNVIPNLKEYVGGARITAELGQSRLQGRITVSWRVVSEDGHPVSGSIFFNIRPQKIGK